MPNEIPAASIIQAGIGLGESVIGLINEGKTKREAERLARERPQYQISPLAGEDLALSESDLANGMSAGASKAYNDLNNSQFSASLGAILKSGGNPNNIGDLYGNTQEGRLRLAQMKDNLRLQQINNYVRANQAMQQEQQTKWQVNEFAPWEDKAQANAAARQGAQQQIYNGLNTFGSGAMNAANSIQEQDSFRLPIGAGGEGFNNYRATGIPDVNYNPPPIQVGNVSPYSYPQYP